MSEWISVQDRLPEEFEDGLCCMHRHDNSGEPLIVAPFTYMSNEFHPFADDDNIENDDYWVDPLYWPTHWMKFPEPPK